MSVVSFKSDFLEVLDVPVSVEMSSRMEVSALNWEAVRPKARRATAELAVRCLADLK